MLPPAFNEARLSYLVDFILYGILLLLILFFSILSRIFRFLRCRFDCPLPACFIAYARLCLVSCVNGKERRLWNIEHRYIMLNTHHIGLLKCCNILLLLLLLFVSKKRPTMLMYSDRYRIEGSSFSLTRLYFVQGKNYDTNMVYNARMLATTIVCVCVFARLCVWLVSISVPCACAINTATKAAKKSGKQPTNVP